jgi:outer membrane protein TolC
MPAFFLPGQYAVAQLGQGGNLSQGAQANSVPVSGRSGQSGSVTVMQTPIPGATTSVNTINPTVQVQGPFGGSIPGTSKVPFSGQLSFREAIERGLAYNLGAVQMSHALRQARGQSRVARSFLLPNLNGGVSESVEQENLRALGIRPSGPIAGAAFPSIVGPFNFADLRAGVSQTVADWTAWNNYRSSKDVVHANEFLARDARDLVVLAVGAQYLQVIAAKARVESARAQLATANTLYDQAVKKRAVGVVAQIDVNRSQVQLLTQQQRLISLQNDLSKTKINLARSIGLPPTDRYDTTDELPFSPAPSLTVEEAVRGALAKRADAMAAQAQVRAAERGSAAAHGERFPSLAVSADYGVIGAVPAQSHGTFFVTGTVHLPLWDGGRTEGDIEQADAVLAQRRAELADIKDQIEADVRKAYFDLEASLSQVDVARKNLETTRQTLELTLQRFNAGVTDSFEVVQSQELVATAELDYINSVFAHNLAKLSIARSVGSAADNLEQFLSFH